MLTLEPGAAVVYDEPINLRALRTDLIFYPVPFDKIVAAVCPDAKLRRLVRNMIYDGVLAHLLDIDLGRDGEGARPAARQEAEGAGAQHGARCEAGFDYARDHLRRSRTRFTSSGWTRPPARS